MRARPSEAVLTWLPGLAVLRVSLTQDDKSAANDFQETLERIVNEIKNTTVSRDACLNSDLHLTRRFHRSTPVRSSKRFEKPTCQITSMVSRASVPS